MGGMHGGCMEGVQGSMVCYPASCGSVAVNLRNKGDQDTSCTDAVIGQSILDEGERGRV